MTTLMVAKTSLLLERQLLRFKRKGEDPPDGRELEKWDESDPPDRPNNSNKPRNDVPPATRTIGPNGEIIRK